MTFEPPPSGEELAQRIERLEDAMGETLTEMKDLWARLFLAGEIQRFAFDESNLQQTDDRGSNALSYAVYNPNAFRIFVALAGGEATEDGGLVVPKEKLVVAPLQINGHVNLGVDAEEVGEGGSILRVRFPLPQQFAAYAL
jgi:hypothetical protein